MRRKFLHEKLGKFFEYPAMCGENCEAQARVVYVAPEIYKR